MKGHRTASWGRLLLAVACLAVAAPAAASAATGEATGYLVDSAHSSGQPAGGPTGVVAQRWARDLGGHLSYPLVLDGRVFVVAEDPTTDLSTLDALDAATGATLWSRRFGGYTALTAGDGSLYLTTGRSHLLALDPATGDTRWATPGPASAAVPPVAADGVVVVGVVDRGLAAYDADGHLLWQTPPVGGLPPAFAVDDGTVVVNAQGAGLDGYDLQTGALRWHSTDAGLLSADAVSVLGDRAFLTHAFADDPPTLTADPATGLGLPRLATDALPAADADGTYLMLAGTLTARATPDAPARWSFTGDGALTGSPLTAGGRVWIASTQGRLYGLDPLTGAVAVDVPLGAPADTPPDPGPPAALAAGGGLLLAPSGGRLVALSGTEAVTGATAPAFPATPPSSGSADATSEDQDPARDGLADAAPAPPLAQRWTRHLAGASHALIVGDRAFVLERARGFRLSAVSLADGHTLWQEPLNTIDSVFASVVPEIAYDDGRVFAVDDLGQTEAFSADDGRPLWSAQERLSAADPSVVADGGTVYASWEGEPSAAAAYDEATGARRWGTGLTGDLGSPVLTDDALVLGTGCDLEEAVARGSGDPLWTSPGTCEESQPDDPLIAAGGRVLGLFEALDPLTGATVDSLEASSSRAAGHGVLVEEQTTTTQAQRLDGQELWTAPLPDPAGGISPPLLSASDVYVANGDHLEALGLADGHLEWDATTTGGALVAGRGVLLQVGADALTAYDAAGPAPRAQLDGPAPPTRGAPAPVTFSAPAGSTTSCAIDGGAWTACASPWTPGALDEGEHVLRVRASASGVDGPAASTPVVIDRTGPQAVVIGGLAVHSREEDPSVSFRADEPATFTCSLDGAAPTPCEAPLQLRTLDGQHTFTVTATDLLGNVGPPATYAFDVDGTRPDVHVDQVPLHPTDPFIPITFTVDDPTATVTCSVDDEPATPCSSPYTVRTDDPYQHQITVSAVDAAGNAGDDTATWSRTISGWPQAYINGDPSRDHATRTLSFAISRTPADLPTQCRIDDEAWRSCTGSTWVRDDVPEGAHHVQIRDAALPAAGISQPFVADWTPPGETIVSAVPDGTTWPEARVDVRRDDDPDHPLPGVCTLDGTTIAGGCYGGIDASGMLPGPHVFTATYTDTYGNVGEPITYRWTQLPAPTGPTAAIIDAPVDGSTQPDPTIELQGPRFRECRVDDISWRSCDSNLDLQGLAPGEHTVEVTTTGQATPISVRWRVDPPPAPPTALSADPHELNWVTARFSLAPRQLAACAEEAVGFFNASPCSSPARLGVADDGWRHTVTVYAIDRYGTPSAPATARYTSAAPGDPAPPVVTAPGDDDSDPGLPTGPVVGVAPAVGGGAPAAVVPLTPVVAPTLVDLRPEARGAPTPAAATNAPRLAGALRAATLRRGAGSTVVVALRPPAAGRVHLTLLHGRSVVAQGTATAHRAGRLLHVTLRLTGAGRRLARGTFRVVLRAQQAGLVVRRAVTLRR